MALGTLLFAVGLASLTVLAGLTELLIGVSHPDLGDPSYWLPFLALRLGWALLGGIVVNIGHAVRLKGRKQLAKTTSLESVLSRPVQLLYLRAFADDDRQATLAQRGLFVKARTGEEELLRLFEGLSPIAIGRPGEDLPRLGASRLYLDSPQWQPVVTQLMERARLVVIRLGQTDGVSWELQAGLRLVSPRRLLLLSPWSADELEAYRAAKAPALPPIEGTPSATPASTSRNFCGIRGIVWFDHAGRPRYLAAAAYPWIAARSLKSTLSDLIAGPATWPTGPL